MEQAIAAEWGRFLRDVETQRTEASKDNGVAGQAHKNGTKLAAWQRLEEALAQPPTPAAPLGEISVSGSAIADELHGQEMHVDDSFLARFAKATAKNGNRMAQPKIPVADSQTAPESQSDAAAENGTYAMRSQWVGTGFEERRVLVTPPPVESPLQEPEQIHETSHSDAGPAIPLADAAVDMAAPFAGETSEEFQNHDGSRWYVLKGMLGGAMAPQEAPVASQPARIPVLEVFSLAGGVGKTSLVATLGRALSSRGERVLLVEATSFGPLPYFFGASDCRPGVLRTFRPPASSSDCPIRMTTIDPDSLSEDTATQGSLVNEIEGWARGASRIIVDVATRSTATARALSWMSPIVLVPLIPDINSVLCASSIDSFFQRNVATQASQPEVFYVLNQFNESLPLHQEVQNVLHDRLGDRMLPFTLQSTPAVSEALADGMTIIDYAADSPATDDFLNLAKWVEDVAAPANMQSRGMRWSER
jgi:cellulose synthase operon protein YhjQ